MAVTDTHSLPFGVRIQSASPEVSQLVEVVLRKSFLGMIRLGCTKNYAAVFVIADVVSFVRLDEAHLDDVEAGLRPPFRSKQEVIIDAPVEAVWSFSMDLTKIPEYHPRVFKVDLIDRKVVVQFEFPAH